MIKHILSKSTFMYGCQCPKRLFLHKFRPALRNEEDEEQKSIFDSGTDAGMLARDLFKGGVDASPPDPFSYAVSVAATQEYLKTHKVIYEAAFQFEGIMCAVDILVKKGNKWHAYEVKSTNSLKPQHQLDAALQHYVLSKSGLPLSDFSVVHFDRDYIRLGKIDVHQLFKSVSVLDNAISQETFIASKSDELKNMLAAKTEPVVEPGDFCFKPYECDFTGNCRSGMTEEKTEKEVFEPYADNDEIGNFLEQLKYPLYFFDFETVMYGVPAFDYSSPYQQIPFQYSLHVQDTPGSPLRDSAFLGNGTDDPRSALIEQLIHEIGTQGSVIVYNASFERGCIKKLAVNFPQYAKKLLAINDRLMDLMGPFRKGWVRHPDFEGGYSLKVVLPALVPALSYADLEIKEGGTASFTYAQLKNQDEATRNTQRNQLLEYCKLDTLAMAEVLDKLRSM